MGGLLLQLVPQLGQVTGLGAEARLGPEQLAGRQCQARSSVATEHLVQIKGFSQPGQECCRVGFGNGLGRANTALIEALLDF